MPLFSSEKRGARRFAFLLLLALVAAIFYLGGTFAPAYMGKQNLQSAANEIIRRGAHQELTDTDVRAQLTEKIREFGLPDEHKIELWHEGKGMSARISYKHLVRLPFYTYPWPVEISAKNPGF